MKHKSTKLYARGHKCNRNLTYTMHAEARLHRDAVLPAMQRARRRAVIDLNSGEKYESVKDAAEQCKLSIATVSKIAHERGAYYPEWNGFKFRFV